MTHQSRIQPPFAFSRKKTRGLPAHSTPDSAAWLIETLGGTGTHISGRRLFETRAGLWPVSPSPVAEPMNRHPTVVSLGSGAGLFSELANELDLAQSTAFSGGAMVNVYRPKA